MGSREGRQGMARAKEPENDGVVGSLARDPDSKDSY